MLKGDIDEMQQGVQKIAENLRTINRMSDDVKELLDVSISKDISAAIHDGSEYVTSIDRAYIRWDVLIADKEQEILHKWDEVARGLRDIDKCRKVILNEPDDKIKPEKQHPDTVRLNWLVTHRGRVSITADGQYYAVYGSDGSWRDGPIRDNFREAIDAVIFDINGVEDE